MQGYPRLQRFWDEAGSEDTNSVNESAIHVDNLKTIEPSDETNGAIFEIIVVVVVAAI